MARDITAELHKLTDGLVVDDHIDEQAEIDHLTKLDIDHDDAMNVVVRAVAIRLQHELGDVYRDGPQVCMDPDELGLLVSDMAWKMFMVGTLLAGSDGQP